MTKREEIAQVVNAEHLADWMHANPKVFYKDGEPYGLIANLDGYIASTTKSPELPFTQSMLKFLYEINAKQTITLVTDVEAYQDKIRAVLEPRGFICTLEHGILYSRREKWVQER